MDPYTYFELVLTDAEPGFCPKPDQRPAAKWNRWWHAQFDILADSAIALVMTTVPLLKELKKQ